jgi:hypothetical protein
MILTPPDDVVNAHNCRTVAQLVGSAAVGLLMSRTIVPARIFDNSKAANKRLWLSGDF